MTEIGNMRERGSGKDTAFLYGEMVVTRDQAAKSCARMKETTAVTEVGPMGEYGVSRFGLMPGHLDNC